MTCTCCQPLLGAQRIHYPAALFGLDFPLRVEPTIFTIADRLSSSYAGGAWTMLSLSNGGFYMAPDSEEAFKVCCENGYEGRLSPSAFGITVCLYAFSLLSFRCDPLAETCSNQFELLRAHALDHREAQAILAAID